MGRLRLAIIACTLIAVLAGCGRPAAARPPGRSGPGATFALLQMNLCLSGLAGCYARVDYPAGVNEAAGLIVRTRPDAVTLSEACSGDAARIARRVGYRLRFSTVIYGGRPFACIDPGGRGVFGDAVLTRAAVVRSTSQPFPGQTGVERRRWLCVTTAAAVSVCTAHLNIRARGEVAGNDRQCGELAAILATRAGGRGVIFGGDVNRGPSCAPSGFWTRTDAAARQDPGLQHVYGDGALRSPAAEVLPFAHSDHDALLVHADR
jgi:endonuclease/exonuclease/phosphatase (EEP) superfamily protein YafD